MLGEDAGIGLEGHIARKHIRARLPDGKRHPIDEVITDGDTVTLGGVTLTAHLTAGHTPGCTTWTTTAIENATRYDVVFGCSLPQVPLRIEEMFGRDLTQLGANIDASKNAHRLSQKMLAQSRIRFKGGRAWHYGLEPKEPLPRGV